MTVKICIADRQSRVRHGLCIFLEQQTDWKVVGEAAEAHELLKEITLNCPDLLILDWDLPGVPSENLLGRLRQVSPRLHVIALGGREGLRQPVLETGVDAFVSKTEPPEKIVMLIQQIVGDTEAQTKVHKPMSQESEPSDDNFNGNIS